MPSDHVVWIDGISIVSLADKQYLRPAIILFFGCRSLHIEGNIEVIIPFPCNHTKPDIKMLRFRIQIELRPLRCWSGVFFAKEPERVQILKLRELHQTV